MKTFLKTLIALTLATTFLLTGCDTPDISGESSVETLSDTSDHTSSSVSEDSFHEVSSSIEHSSAEAFTTDDIDPIFKTEYSKNPLEVTEEDLKYLENQAPVLTRHLVLTAVDLDGNVTEDEINRFFALLSGFGDNADYRYTPILRSSQDMKYSLFCFEDVNRTAYEAFGKEEWSLELPTLDIDQKNKVYAADLAYGMWMGNDCSDYEISITQTTAEVEFTLYSWGEKDGDPHEFDEGRYIARYSVMKDEAGAFLRFDEIARP